MTTLAISTFGDVAQTLGVIVAARLRRRRDLRARAQAAGAGRARRPRPGRRAARPGTCGPRRRSRSCATAPRCSPPRSASARPACCSGHGSSTAGRCCCRWPWRSRCRSACRSRRAATPRTCSCRCTSSSARARSRTRFRGFAAVPAKSRRRGALEWILGGTVVLYALQASYSSDFDRALQQLVFFYVPFAVLFALLQRVRWTPKVLAGCLAILAGLALVFVGVGFYEYADAPGPAEPEGHQRERVRVVLPRQLAVLRPEHLRPLPGDRDAARRRRAAVGAVGARRSRRRPGPRGAVGGAGRDVLAVVVRRAAGRPCGARRAALGLEARRARGGGRRGRGRRGGRARLGRAAPGAGRQRLGQRRDERALRPHRGRRPARRRAAGPRLGLGRVSPRVPRAGEGE